MRSFLAVALLAFSLNSHALELSAAMVDVIMDLSDEAVDRRLAMNFIEHLSHGRERLNSPAKMKVFLESFRSYQLRSNPQIVYKIRTYVYTELLEDLVRDEDLRRSSSSAYARDLETLFAVESVDGVDMVDIKAIEVRGADGVIQGRTWVSPIDDIIDGQVLKSLSDRSLGHRQFGQVLQRSRKLIMTLPEAKYSFADLQVLRDRLDDVFTDYYTRSSRAASFDGAVRGFLRNGRNFILATVTRDAGQLLGDRAAFNSFTRFRGSLQGAGYGPARRWITSFLKLMKF